jgi:pantoate--beta-alanine ligase
VAEAELVTTRAQLQAALRPYRRSDGDLALVPTMGALHEGHLALVEAARATSEVVVVSLFVNPTQFNDPTDFDAYPRDLASDRRLATEAGATLVFAPSIPEMYPSGQPQVTVDPGSLGDLLEGVSRPGHFRGVATVVAKLLALVAPDFAFFGEKDYQQLLVIRSLVRDLSFPLEVVGVPTVREPDGLARSSRNGRLSPAERRAATVLSRALGAGVAHLRAGGQPSQSEALMAEVVASEPLAQLDYAVARDPQSLGEAGEGPVRLLVAASFGGVRLIDNCAASRS